MTKRFAILLLIAALLCTLLGGCAGENMYDATFFMLFDTVTTVQGMAANQAEFNEKAQNIYDSLLIYHQLFDIYQSYEGIANLKTVNEAAGVAPVKVDSRIIRLLQDCKRYYALTHGKVNVAMGSVLKLWHDAREAALADPDKARLPSQQALEAAKAHTDLNAVVIDEAASTVFISDPLVRLDVGAIAKGWAVQQVAQSAPAGLLINVGGNICATGPKASSGTPWTVGIRHPDGQSYLHTVTLTKGSIVTSGDYQRSYQVDGETYHHIIHPQTLFPATDWRSVTVICPDSGLADALSTALFLLDQAEGQALLSQCGAEAVWMDREGKLFYSTGFGAYIKQ